MDDGALVSLVERSIRVMTYEVDFAGVVSNQVYFRWLEDLRMDLLQSHLDMRELLKLNALPVLTHTEIDYKRPLRLLDEVKGRMWVEELDGPKWSLRGQFVKDGVVCADARQWGLFVDPTKFTVVDAPPQLPRVKRTPQRP